MDSERENLRHIISSIDAGDGAKPCDNLVIALASYFERCVDCPDDELDEHGWQPWAIEQTDITINRIVDAVIDYAKGKAK